MRGGGLLWHLRWPSGAAGAAYLFTSPKVQRSYPPRAQALDSKSLEAQLCHPLSSQATCRYSVSLPVRLRRAMACATSLLRGLPAFQHRSPARKHCRAVSHASRIPATGQRTGVHRHHDDPGNKSGISSKASDQEPPDLPVGLVGRHLAISPCFYKGTKRAVSTRYVFGT